MSETIMTDEQFLVAVQKWANTVRREAKNKATAFGKGKKKNYVYSESGKSRYSGKTEKKLSEDISYAVKTQFGEVHHIQFKFPLHGIFRAFGVGNGQPAKGSFSKQALKTYIRRSPSDWLNEPIEKNIETFSDLVANHYGDTILNFVKYSKIQNL